MAKPIDILLEILDDGFVVPTFAPIANRYNRTPQPTIYGPHPAVCLTEQTLANIAECAVTRSRYSGYGIAYHKVALYELGGRPVIYGSEDLLGRRLRQNEAGHVEGRRICTEGLDVDWQHLFALYKPIVASDHDYPIDFTWEKEWRINPPGGKLPIALDHYILKSKNTPSGAIIVEKDADVAVVRTKLCELEAAGRSWVSSVGRIISIEETKRRLEAGEMGCGRIETWVDATTSTVESVFEESEGQRG